MGKYDDAAVYLELALCDHNHVLSARGDGSPWPLMDMPASILKGKNLFFYLTVGTMLIPGEATLLTNYETISKLHMINTYQELLLCLLALRPVLFMRQYFLGVSASIKEASEMDGCGGIAFLQNSDSDFKPILVTVFITAFVEIWNVYLWPMLIRTAMRCGQSGRNRSAEQFGGIAYGVIMAGAVIVLIPSLLVFYHLSEADYQWNGNWFGKKI